MYFLRSALLIFSQSIFLSPAAPAAGFSAPAAGFASSAARAPAPSSETSPRARISLVFIGTGSFEERSVSVSVPVSMSVQRTDLYTCGPIEMHHPGEEVANFLNE